MSLKKNLFHLKYAALLFQNLSAGKHIDLLQDVELWTALTGEFRQDYSDLFTHLGQNLKIDPRGFAYFELDDVDSKGTRPLTLIYLLIFQKQADAGIDLNRFDLWHLDPEFWKDLREKNAEILRSENCESEERWKAILNKATALGFMQKEAQSMLLLAASHRFLDLFSDVCESLTAEEQSLENTESEIILGESESELNEDLSEDWNSEVDDLIAEKEAYDE